MWLKRAAEALAGGMGPVSRALQWVAAGVLAVMMFLTASDVSLRQFRLPILGTDDLTAFLMVILISFGLAYCALEKGHVQVELLVERFPRRVKAAFASFTTLLGLGLCVLIAWQGIVNAVSVYQSGATSWTLNIIVFPFAALVSFGFVWFSLVLLADFLNALARVVEK